MQIRRISITLLALCAAVSGLSAQTTYRGTVTDQKGNPIAGVRVADKSGVYTTTDLYGHYVLELPDKPGRLSFNIVGFNPRRNSVQPDMNIKLIKSTAFNSPNYGKHFFLGLQAATAEKSLRLPTLGINLGVLKNSWGWYCDLVLPAFQGEGSVPEYVNSATDYNSYSDLLTGQRYSYACYISTGAMIPFPIIRSLYLDAGLRYGAKYVYEEFVSYYYDYYSDDYYDNHMSAKAERNGISLEFGLSYRISHFMVNVKGAYLIANFDSEDNAQLPSGSMKSFDALSFGLSYIF